MKQWWPNLVQDSVSCRVLIHQKRNPCALKLKDTFHRNISPESSTSSSPIGVWRKVEIQNLEGARHGTGLIALAALDSEAPYNLIYL